jgi:hypothetical protein
MKKIISSVLSVVVALSLGTSAYAQPSQVEAAAANHQVDSITVNLNDYENNLIGTLTTKTIYDREVRENGIFVTITTEKDYELNDSYAEKSEFKDTNEVTTIEVTNDNEYFVNGEQLSEDILNEEAGTDMIAARDSGGVPSLGHYYDNNDYKNYYFASYSGMTLDGDPTGNHIGKNITNTNAYFDRASNTLDILYGDHQTYLWAKVGLNSTILGFPLTLLNIFAAIAGGGAIGIAASQVYSAYQDCNSDLSKAYGYISQM